MGYYDSCAAAEAAQRTADSAVSSASWLEGRIDDIERRLHSFSDERDVNAGLDELRAEVDDLKHSVLEQLVELEQRLERVAVR